MREAHRVRIPIVGRGPFGDSMGIWTVNIQRIPCHDETARTMNVLVLRDWLQAENQDSNNRKPGCTQPQQKYVNRDNTGLPQITKAGNRQTPIQHRVEVGKKMSIDPSPEGNPATDDPVPTNGSNTSPATNAQCQWSTRPKEEKQQGRVRKKQVKGT